MAEDGPDPTPRRLAGFELLRPIARGGMGSLYLGRRVGAGGFERHVAVKVVHPDLVFDKSLVEMLLMEARLCARIQHPNVVHVEDVGEDQGTHFIVMEYVNGVTLSAILKQLAARGRRLKPELAVHVAAQVAAGLHAAHTARDERGSLGIVHRDVSPQNVLVSYGGHVKLIDFGIAKTLESGQTTGSIKGKIRYMSPEQAWAKPLDPRSDIYSLGLVLWELLTMHRPFGSGGDLALLDAVRAPRIPPPSEILAELPRALDEAVMHGLRSEAADRPASAWAFRQELFEALPSAREVESPRIARLVSAVMAQDAPPSDPPERLSVTDAPAGAEPAEAIIDRHTASIPMWEAPADLAGVLDAVRPSLVPTGDARGPREAPPTPTPETASGAVELTAVPRSRSIWRTLGIGAALVAASAAGAIGFAIYSSGGGSSESGVSGSEDLPAAGNAEPVASGPIGLGPPPDGGIARDAGGGAVVEAVTPSVDAGVDAGRRRRGRDGRGRRRDGETALPVLPVMF